MPICQANVAAEGRGGDGDSYGYLLLIEPVFYFYVAFLRRLLLPLPPSQRVFTQNTPRLKVEEARRKEESAPIKTAHICGFRQLDFDESAFINAVSRNKRDSSSLPPSFALLHGCHPRITPEKAPRSCTRGSGLAHDVAAPGLQGRRRRSFAFPISQLPSLSSERASNRGR